MFQRWHNVLNDLQHSPGTGSLFWMGWASIWFWRRGGINMFCFWHVMQQPWTYGITCGLMPAHRLRPWPNIRPARDTSLLFFAIVSIKLTNTMPCPVHTKLAQCWLTVRPPSATLANSKSTLGQLCVFVGMLFYGVYLETNYGPLSVFHHFFSLNIQTQAIP